MAQGKIKKLTDKGFGFIETDRGDLFFHLSALQETTYEQLYEGQVVEYEAGQGPKGPRAEWVKPA
ncbi:MAG: cold-shock protein [Maioricimonas sp. JB045]|uniref:cold-shock protein n=1 Tax=Maioricimonas sp. JC845 TaxID=3232138 RepID=UPI00345A6EE6